MKIVIFGLSVSSAWGNGHATLWRGLISALDGAGHEVEFFERDVPHHAEYRDLRALPGRARLHLYADWEAVRAYATASVDEADVAIVTSYCPDGRVACELVLDSRARSRVFYDLDTPVTLAQLAAGTDIPYLPRTGLGRFDLVLSFTGGHALVELRDRLGARRVAPLYGSVDPSVHRPASATPAWLGACSYLGIWAEDRRRSLEALFLEPARRRPRLRFMLGGSMAPEVAVPNIKRVEHVTPAAHPTFYASCPITISVTRQPMAALGHCPSGRLFEAAACGVPVLTDAWAGIEEFFTPNEEILIAYSPEQALAAIERDPEALAKIGDRARKRAFCEHTAERRAAQLVELVS